MSEAERLVDALDSEAVTGRVSNHTGRKAAAELRRLSAVEQELEAHKAARMAYASEFPLNGEGEPDVGSIHQNIRALKAELAALKVAMGEPVATVQCIKGVTIGFLEVMQPLGTKLYVIPKDKP